MRSAEHDEEMLYRDYYNLPTSFRASDTSRRIDAVVELDDALLFVEVKWSELKRREAERILEELKGKAERFEGKKRFLLIAKKIEDKGEGMRDLEDLERLVRG